ncbi:hypothetical protein FOA52_009558 [Chlamydomonas sp. UWO 241]|nr:hypothetical protein FOA52_009558 [Chlamydomonas sp. UWO 241]
MLFSVTMSNITRDVSDAEIAGVQAAMAAMGTRCPGPAARRRSSCARRKSVSIAAGRSLLCGGEDSDEDEDAEGGGDSDHSSEQGWQAFSRKASRSIAATINAAVAAAAGEEVTACSLWDDVRRAIAPQEAVWRRRAERMARDAASKRELQHQETSDERARRGRASAPGGFDAVGVSISGGNSLAAARQQRGLGLLACASARGARTSTPGSSCSSPSGTGSASGAAARAQAQLRGPALLTLMASASPNGRTRSVPAAPEPQRAPIGLAESLSRGGARPLPSAAPSTRVRPPPPRPRFSSCEAREAQSPPASAGAGSGGDGDGADGTNDEASILTAVVHICVMGPCASPAEGAKQAKNEAAMEQVPEADAARPATAPRRPALKVTLPPGAPLMTLATAAPTCPASPAKRWTNATAHPHSPGTRAMLRCATATQPAALSSPLSPVAMASPPSRPSLRRTATAGAALLSSSSIAASGGPHSPRPGSPAPGSPTASVAMPMPLPRSPRSPAHAAGAASILAQFDRPTSPASPGSRAPHTPARARSVGGGATGTCTGTAPPRAASPSPVPAARPAPTAGAGFSATPARVASVLDGGAV